MTKSQKAEQVERTIRTLLEEIRDQYMTDTFMFPIILRNDEKQIENLRVIDCLYQSVLTSLQFGQYRRSVWYLQAFSLVCEKTFNGNYQEKMMQTLQAHIMGLREIPEQR